MGFKKEVPQARDLASADCEAYSPAEREEVLAGSHQGRRHPGLAGDPLAAADVLPDHFSDQGVGVSLDGEHDDDSGTRRSDGLRDLKDLRLGVHLRDELGESDAHPELADLVREGLNAAAAVVVVAHH